MKKLARTAMPTIASTTAICHLRMWRKIKGAICSAISESGGHEIGLGWGASPTLLGFGACGSFQPNPRAPIAQPWPEQALIQVDVSVDNVGGVGRFGDGLAGFVIDGGAEIVAAGHQINLIFNGPGFGQSFVAAP